MTTQTESQGDGWYLCPRCGVILDEPFCNCDRSEDGRE
jgi:hypothetical protein